MTTLHGELKVEEIVRYTVCYYLLQCYQGDQQLQLPRGSRVLSIKGIPNQYGGNSQIELVVAQPSEAESFEGTNIKIIQDWYILPDNWTLHDVIVNYKATVFFPDQNIRYHVFVE